MTTETSVQGGLVIEHGPLVAATPLTQAQMIQSQIDALERQYMMPRITREMHIIQAEERAAALGVPLAQFAAENKGYAGLKALDAQIAALRAQR